jgi:hypothetical protein
MLIRQRQLAIGAALPIESIFFFHMSPVERVGPKPASRLHSAKGPVTHLILSALLSGGILGPLGILLLIIGAFVVMGGLQLLGLGLIGLAVAALFVFSSWAIGKLVFHL